MLLGVIILSAVLKRRMILADKAKSLFISKYAHFDEFSCTLRLSLAYPMNFGPHCMEFVILGVFQM